MITQFIAKNKVTFTLLVIYEITTTIMVLYIIIDNTLLIRFVISAMAMLQFFIIYLSIKRGWKNFYFSQFSRWGFIIFSNLFYNYNFKANLEEISRYDKKIKVPKQFKNSINLNDFNIKFKRKKWKWKRKGLNFKLKGWKKVYTSNKKISYEFLDYFFEYKKDQTVFFHISLLIFEKISFCYLIIPSSINIDDLINIDVKFPLHYASSVQYVWHEDEVKIKKSFLTVKCQNCTKSTRCELDRDIIIMSNNFTNNDYHIFYCDHCGYGGKKDTRFRINRELTLPVSNFSASIYFPLFFK